MRSWGITYQEDLSQWLRRQGFPIVRPGHRLSAEAQEHILNVGVAADARVALLEAVFVLITVARLPEVRRRVVRPEAPHSLPDGTWEQMDDVDLHEVFLLRIPMLKSCPYFLRGRLRECFATTLRERYRAKLAGDIVAEERAWKAFGLVPLLLLHRPRGCGSLGRDELALRADRFARGQSFELLEDAQSHVLVLPGRNLQDQTQENARRGRAAQSRVERGQVSRARQELTGAALAPKTADTLREWQEKRPIAQVREIPPVVLEYTPERPLDLDADLFGQCLSSAPSGTAPTTGKFCNCCSAQSKMPHGVRCHNQCAGRSCRRR